MSLGANILVVESEVPVREMLIRELEKAGHNVTSADSPEKAMQLIEQSEERIDLIVAEVVQSKIGGFQLKESLGDSAPPFIFTNLYIRGQDPGFQGCRFLKKPFFADELLVLVQQALDGQ